MKIFRKLIIVLVLVGIMYGCSDDFLTQLNTKEATEESLFDKEQDALKLVNAVYNTFHNDDFVIKAMWYQANFLTQDYQNWGSDTFFATYEIPTNFGGLEIFWVRSYEGIARANSAMVTIPQMIESGALSQELGDRLFGEALFLRGLLYYNLATEFGGVPLELELVTDDGRHPRNTEEEVFASAADDFQTAADLLQWDEDMNPSDKGRATKGAALAYLGEAQMWLKQYDEALITYNMLEGRYEIEEDYLNIHAFDNQNGKESIFSIQYITVPDMRNGSTDTSWLSSFCLPEEISGTGYAYVNKVFYESFEPGDLRRSPTVLGPGETHPDPIIDISSYHNIIDKFGGINTLGTVENPLMGTDGQRSGYYPVKTWRDPNVTGRYGPYYFRSSQNHILLRYGQILLSKAEALYRTGNEGGARDIINNVIRDRAGLAAAPAGEDFMTIMANEYRHELGGEFSLFFLLRRAEVAYDFVLKHYNIVIPPGHALMPIPVEQIATNENLVQNPGY